MTESSFIRTIDQPDRNLVVLLLDTSASMGVAERTGDPPKIQQLIDALDQFLSDGMHTDSLVDGGINRLQVNGEIAIGAFRETARGDVNVRWLELAASPVEDGWPFYYVQEVEGLSQAARRELVAQGRTPMAEAIDQALDVIESRKDGLLEDGLTHECRPNLYLLTDGASTSNLERVAARLHTEEEESRVLFWAFGTPKCDRNQLLLLADKYGVTKDGREWGNCVLLGKRPLGDVLQFVNKSMRHQPGQAQEASAEDIYGMASEWLDDDDMAPE